MIFERGALLDVPENGRPIVFLSDAHLGSAAGRPDREDLLVNLMRGLCGSAAALFVMGDLFDFWFEYRHAIPKGTFRVARALADLVESGVPTAYFGGNHDFWAGSFLRRELGLAVFDEPVTATLQGRRVHLAHGDGLGPGDGGYKLLKRVLRARWAVAGYRSLHPDLGIPFARRVSAFSHKHTEARDILLPKILRDIARARMRDGVTAMVMGHIHEPAHFQGEGRDFLLIGDWMDNFTHVRMERGAFTLYRLDAGVHVPVGPEPFPFRW